MTSMNTLAWTFISIGWTGAIVAVFAVLLLMASLALDVHPKVHTAGKILFVIAIICSMVGMIGAIWAVELL